MRSDSWCKTKQHPPSFDRPRAARRRHVGQRAGAPLQVLGAPRRAAHHPQRAARAHPGVGHRPRRHGARALGALGGQDGQGAERVPAKEPRRRGGPQPGACAAHAAARGCRCCLCGSSRRARSVPRLTAASPRPCRHSPCRSSGTCAPGPTRREASSPRSRPSTTATWRLWTRPQGARAAAPPCAEPGACCLRATPLLVGCPACC